MKLVKVVNLAPIWKLWGAIFFKNSLFAFCDIVISIPDAIVKGTLLSDTMELLWLK